ncbi:MAG TPA: uroporphyrinogen-III synthase [Bacteroidota bacterium]|nr:uroporphyrinogen-III synthase [Bacteroidota bacterium]
MNLRNRTILITRRAEQAGEMAREIEKRGGTAVIVPMITITPPASWKECDEAIAKIGTFDAVVFTSTNAVRSFYERAGRMNVPRSTLAGLDTVAIGQSTARAVEERGIPVQLVPEKYSGASLAEALGSSLSGKRVLLPRGNRAHETVADALRDSGATVVAVVVYATEKPGGLPGESLVHRVLSGEFDVVTFASPSATEGFRSLFSPQDLSAVPDHAKIAVIGPTTADAVLACGLPVDIIAHDSTARGLVQAIDDFYG